MEKDITFEDKLWKAADKLRKKVEVNDEKMRRHALEDEDYYLAMGVLPVSEEASWAYIAKHAGHVNVSEILDKAVEVFEEKYPKQLKDVIPKKFTQINLDHHDYAYLINIFNQIEFGIEDNGRNIFGRVYEYFLGKFTEAEGERFLRCLYEG